MLATQLKNSETSARQVQIEDVIYQTADKQFQLKINSFELFQGENVAITGPSGSGKTTLLSLISGYKTAISGTIQVLGSDLRTSSEKQRETHRIDKMGIIFQDFRLIDYLTVRENIALASFLSRSTSHVNLRERVDSIADQLQLKSLLHRYPNQLSQGERQRVAIGRAIFQQPKLILADEPTGNLDPATAAQSLDLLFQAVEQSSATLVMVTHDHSLLSRFSRQIEMTQLSHPVSAWSGK